MNAPASTRLPQLPHDLDGLRCIVTGGASGIGAAVVAQLEARGARVAILDRAVRDAGPATAIACDVGETGSVERGVARAAEVLGGLDVVVNNAGIGAAGPVEGLDEGEWLNVLNINVVGMARVAGAALPHLRESAHGAIVNMSSILSEIGVPDRVLYSASKGAVTAMSRAMAADLVASGIRVNCVLPGTARTPWIERLLGQADDPEEMARQLAGRQPIGRLVSAEEVAFVVANLVSPLSAAVTGSCVLVDGGLAGLRLPV